jgi:hypothetical protein
VLRHGLPELNFAVDQTAHALPLLHRAVLLYDRHPHFWLLFVLSANVHVTFTPSPPPASLQGTLVLSWCSGET